MYRRIRRRRLTALTNYRRRIAQLKGGMRRLVVRRSNRSIRIQIVEYENNGDKVIASSSSAELKALGWEPRCNIPTAYLTGLLLGKKLNDKGYEYILDIGLYRPVKGSVIFAAAKGFSDGGAKLLNSIEFDSSRLSGMHIAKYAGASEKQRHKPQFSSYIKAGFDAKAIAQNFDTIKKSIVSK